MLYENIKKLVQYGIETGLTPACEKNYATNLLLDVLISVLSLGFLCTAGRRIYRAGGRIW